MELRWSRTRVPFVSSFCCPPNVLRTVAESANYAYAKSDRAIWINLYGGSKLRTMLSGGDAVTLIQETEYPWSGRVRVTITEAAPAAFALKLRIPSRAAGASLRLNDNPVEITPRPSSFVELRRVWANGDRVELDLPMSPRLMESNPYVEETLNQVAIQRGPIVYCLESVDLPPGIRLTDIAIPGDLDLVARYDRNLLGGVVVLDGTLQARATESWNDQLYREFRPGATKAIATRFIPYSVWGNRGPSEMSVWLPLRVR